MRGVFDLQEALSPRLEIAVEQMVSGSGFLYEGVWFHRQGDVLRCDAVSPWHSAGLHDAEARSLLSSAAGVLQSLCAVSPVFADAIGSLTPWFGVVDDLDTSWAPIVELVDGQLVWQRPSPLG